MIVVDIFPQAFLYGRCPKLVLVSVVDETHAGLDGPEIERRLRAAIGPVRGAPMHVRVRDTWIALDFEIHEERAGAGLTGTSAGLTGASPPRLSPASSLERGRARWWARASTARDDVE